MPWSTPTLSQVRQQNRDYLTGKLGVPIIPNSVARVLADANGGNAHLNLQYIDWLSLQLLPDTAEQVFLDKWANIFLVNADGSRGRKQATYATGTVTLVADVPGTLFPAGEFLTSAGTSVASGITLQTTAQIAVAAAPSPVAVRALDAGSAGNLPTGTLLSIANAVSGVSSQGATVVSLTGGTDEETDDELRIRVLARIRQPPMGGDADDYVNWALSVAGVTRAWCSPNEVAIGTVTVRIMCDDLRETGNPLTNGFPLDADIAAVQAFLDTVRPVTVKEFWVVSPIAQPINGVITNLAGDTPGLRAAINTSIAAMLFQRAKPGYAVGGVTQPATTIPAAWVSEAIFSATNGVVFDLAMADAVMANPGCLAVLGSFS